MALGLADGAGNVRVSTANLRLELRQEEEQQQLRGWAWRCPSSSEGMNEATWQRVAQWEMLHRGECDTPTVLRFQAKPHDLRHAHSGRDAVATRCKVDERSLRWEGLLTCDTFFAFASAQQSRGAVQCGHVPLGARGHPARGNLADQDAPAARPHLQPRDVAEISTLTCTPSLALSMQCVWAPAPVPQTDCCTAAAKRQRRGAISGIGGSGTYSRRRRRTQPPAAGVAAASAAQSRGVRMSRRKPRPAPAAASSLHASASEHTLPMHTNPLQVAAALAPKLESSSDRSDVCTGSGSSAGFGDTALGSASDGALSAVVRKDSSSTTTTDASTNSGHVCPNASKGARSPGTVKLEDEACMDDQKVKAFMKQHGLPLCIPERELGKGAFGHVEMVIITLPDGTTIKAARKTLHACETKGAVAALRRILNQELAGLAMRRAAP
ncbi:hypothetical protein CHLRE_12g525776v5 [Chlamydomonas reinhardtii]|uniref:holocytochrome-c synthase n=1 Tax=Chlamydomonas reinhardtii TaxID=3055 RepID=A0A2K3D4E1_CHLRE|nr:uncharacterized protein CHLRE_12g525776v5 [Chlamydomonas reinhardtii]PNW75402.1 hypothetical protein CHLRE_12g525776v5 [Chlamydomonas reinhardtii]